MKRNIIILMFIIPISIFAQIPNTISWQGILQDANGNNLNGNYNITVKLYDVAINGTAIWTETHNAVQLLDGITNISLGSITPFNLNFDKQYWLEITVGNGTPLPRIKLQSVPYSFHSLVADSLASDIMENDPTWSGSNDTTGIIYRYGNVGIGTSSPKALLHIFGDETGTGNVLFSGSWKLSSAGQAPDSGIGTRMMWYPDKAAFRAGYVANTQWNSDNIGYFSTAFGTNTIASGFNSTAIGSSTSANGNFSFAGGESSEASGEVSVALGDGNKAIGDFSTALGESTTASGLYSTSMGKGTTASGHYSLAAGDNTNSKSAYETVFGRWNTDYMPTNLTGWFGSDRLFTIGNGIASNNRNNALTILKNGKVGIGTDSPLALLHTKGMGSGEGNVLFTGSIKTIGQGLAPDSGAGTRMMWYPDKAAFRAGNVYANQWNSSNIGNYSVAMGSSTTASGLYSTALGNETFATGYSSTSIGSLTTASGDYSVAMGASTKASGSHSLAMGYLTIASGMTSTAIGSETTASGLGSAAIGGNTIAKSAFETVIGRWNTDYTPGNSTIWNSTDRLFVIGNGTSSESKSNALTILKNGKIGIGTDSPSALIHAKGLNTGDGNILFNGAYKTINPGLAPDSGAGTRLMWYPDKSAFRAGTIYANQWNTSNIGDYSVAFGKNTIAKRAFSAAFGDNTTASGTASTAFGEATTASGSGSTSMGFKTIASGYLSIAMGESSQASNSYSTALGFNTTASGSSSTSFGEYTVASGSGSISMGYSSEASGAHSTAMGSNTKASGNSSTAMGANNTATGSASSAMGFNSEASGYISFSMGNYILSKSAFEMVVGSYNADYTPNSTTDWNSSDRLFVVGNGADSNLRSNAITIMKSGRIGLQSVTDPDFALDLPNVAYDGIGRARANAWTTYSDSRIKSERKAIIYGLKEIMMLNPLSYYQHNSIFKNGKLEISDNGAYSFGFIAQDIYKIIPEIVSRPENENIGLWSLSYEKLTPILVKAIQEQQEIIDNQKKKNDSQDMLIQIQNQKIEELEKKLEILMKNFNSNK